MKAFKRMFIANLKEFIRDKSGLFWILAFPVVFISLFGLVFTGDSQPDINFEIGIVADHSEFQQELVENLRAEEVFTVFLGEKEVELLALERGERSLVIELPDILQLTAVNHSITDSMISGTGGNPAEDKLQAEIYYDSSRGEINQALISSFTTVFIEVEDTLLNRERMIEVITTPVQADSLSDFDYVFPGILAMALMQLGLFGAMQFLSLRVNKVIRGLGVTPLSKAALLSSEILLKILVGFVQASIILTIGIFVFDINIVSPLYLVYFLVLLGSMLFVSLGYMLTTFVSSIEGGSGLAQIVQIPMMFLAGIFFPVDMLPGFIQPVVRIIPLTYLADAFRQITVGIPGDYTMATNLIFMTGWMIVTSLVTIKFWRWE